MKQEIEENDLEFTRRWSQTINLECGTIFLNSKLQDDVFFNKLTNITCASKSMLENALLLFQEHKTRPFVYSQEFTELEDLLQHNNFTYYDTQYVLKKNASYNKSNAYRIDNKDSELWSRIFCNAFDCNEWIESVNNIVKNSLTSIEYYVDESNSSCMALYEKKSLLGLYCLGTIPNMRKKGLAKLLVDFAQNEVIRRKLKFLMLETYQRDKLLSFYSNLGFQEIYRKKIYTI